MRPIIVLGGSAGHAPSVEFLRGELDDIIACVLSSNTELSIPQERILWSIVGIDSLHLDADSAFAFKMLEQVCRKIAAGKIQQYDLSRVRASGIGIDLLLDDEDQGQLRPETQDVAKRFLNFLESNPDYWPPRF